MVDYCFTNIQRFNDVELPWPRCFHGSGEEHHCIESPWALTTTGNPPRISSTAGPFLIPFRRLCFLLDTTCFFSSWLGLKIRVLKSVIRDLFPFKLQFWGTASHLWTTKYVSTYTLCLHLHDYNGWRIRKANLFSCDKHFPVSPYIHIPTLVKHF